MRRVFAVVNITLAVCIVVALVIGLTRTDLLSRIAGPISGRSESQSVKPQINDSTAQNTDRNNASADANKTEAPEAGDSAKSSTDIKGLNPVDDTNGRNTTNTDDNAGEENNADDAAMLVSSALKTKKNPPKQKRKKQKLKKQLLLPEIFRRMKLLSR